MSNKNQQMKNNYIFKFFVLFLSLGLTQFGWSQVTTFDYTGDVQTYVVPGGVYSIQIACYGAEGNEGDGDAGGAAGLGGLAQGNLDVSPGETYHIYVGGQNGYNGGGVGGMIDAGNGGGASDVRFGGMDLADRIIVGGGGGGGGSTGCNLPHLGGNGGAGGGDAGTNGEDSPNGGGGFGGELGVGGAAGIGCAGYLGSPGLDDGTGGAGQGCCCATTPGGGGGGGGYVVGGGGGGGSAGTVGCSGNDKGGGGGGAGGSSYTGALTETVTTNGVRSGNGQIIITELCSPLTVTVTAEEICLGESFTATAEGDGAITWDGGVVNGEAFTPAASGTFTYTATSDDEDECVYELEILVNALPEIGGMADPAEVCEGEAIILTGTGGDSYEWGPDDIIDGEPFSLEAGVYTYFVVGTDDETGCENEAEVTVTVHALPEIVATASDEEICLGEGIVLSGTGGETYTWEPDVEDGVLFTPEETGTMVYEVIGIDEFGCVNSSSIEIEVFDPLAITYTFSEELFGADGSIDIDVTGGKTPYTFDWDNDGTGDFDDPEDLTGIAGGDYNVYVVCDAGCTIMETINVSSQLGINEADLLDLEVYPNPTTDQLTILIEGTFNYELIAISGEIIKQGKATDQEIISLKEFAAGVYTLNVKTENGKKSIRVIRE